MNFETNRPLEQEEVHPDVMRLEPTGDLYAPLGDMVPGATPEPQLTVSGNPVDDSVRAIQMIYSGGTTVDDAWVDMLNQNLGGYGDGVPMGGQTCITPGSCDSGSDEPVSSMLIFPPPSMLLQQVSMVGCGVLPMKLLVHDGQTPPGLSTAAAIADGLKQWQKLKNKYPAGDSRREHYQHLLDTYSIDLRNTQGSHSVLGDGSISLTLPVVIQGPKKGDSSCGWEQTETLTVEYKYEYKDPVDGQMYYGGLKPTQRSATIRPNRIKAGSGLHTTTKGEQYLVDTVSAHLASAKAVHQGMLAIDIEDAKQRKFKLLYGAYTVDALTTHKSNPVEQKLTKYKQCFIKWRARAVYDFIDKTATLHIYEQDSGCS